MIKLIIERKSLLSEVKLEDVLTRLDSKKFKKAYPEITPLKASAAKKNIISAIPSDIEEKYKGVLANWMISYLIKNKPELMDYPDIFNPEFTNSAEIFFQIKEQNLQRLLTKKSIAQIASPEELISVVAQAKPEYDKHIADKIENSRKGEGQNLIYQTDKWEVYVPETKGASCALGKGTEWCTAAPGLDYYEDTHSKEHPLIIFINKQNPDEKYQFHYKTNQFMDKNDKKVKPKLIFFKLNEIVKSLSDKLPKETIKSANRYKIEKLPNGEYAQTIEKANGDKYWYQNGKLHRENGPAVEKTNGDKHWFLNAKRHREDGPAIEYADGEKQWWLNNKQHREDGPAVIRANGNKSWWLNDKRLSYSEWKKEVPNPLFNYFKKFLK